METKVKGFVFGTQVLFSEHKFCSHLVWDLLRLTPLVFWFESFTRRLSSCLLSFDLDFWAPDSSYRIDNKFFIHRCQAERKVRLCSKLFYFFWGWILIRLTWNSSLFVPNFTWNFSKKLFRENFSEILCKPRLSSTKTCEILPCFLQFYSGSVLRWKISHKYFYMLFEPR